MSHLTARNPYFSRFPSRQAIEHNASKTELLSMRCRWSDGTLERHFCRRKGSNTLCVAPTSAQALLMHCCRGLKICRGLMMVFRPCDDKQICLICVPPNCLRNNICPVRCNELNYVQQQANPCTYTCCHESRLVLTLVWTNRCCGGC